MRPRDSAAQTRQIAPNRGTVRTPETRMNKEKLALATRSPQTIQSRALSQLSYGPWLQQI
jgi:hypothetical protein